MPREVYDLLIARARSLDLPAARYIRHLARNDIISPRSGLKALLGKLKPSKFTHEKLPTSLPKNLKALILERAIAEELDISSYLTALVLREIALRTIGFTILPMLEGELRLRPRRS